MRLFNTSVFSSTSNAHRGSLEKSTNLMAVGGRRGAGSFIRIHNFDKYNPMPQPKIKTTMEHLLELFYLTTFPN